ncbi:MAG: hypothetical protein GXO99_06135 [Nitrospirae bacterium]|nr:hypothetical protein [Nitrospirota bacterium]
MILDSYNKELAETYKVLANLFTTLPNDELIEQMQEELELNIKEPLDAIVEDYNRLFYGTTDTLPPIESLYVYNKNPSTEYYQVPDIVSDFYRSCGVDLNEQLTQLPPDHIAIEFIFISYLIENNLIDELRAFFKEHIIKWVPLYCDMIQERAQTQFYKEVAAITKEIVLSDYEEILGE